MIKIQNSPIQLLKTNAAVPLLHHLRANGVDVRTRCGGRANCGECRITIISGEKYFTKETPSEIALKELKAFPEDIRLSCQTRAIGDCEIYIGNKHAGE